MASLTTTDGIQYNFDPNNIFAVADHDATTGEAVTCVYGITATVLKVGEAAEAFLARVGAEKFVKLTRASGSPVWIAGAAVSNVSAPLPGVYLPAVKALVCARSLIQGVTEAPAAAVALINAHGGRL